MSDREGRQRSRKIVMFRMGNPVNDRTLSDLKREVTIAARSGDTSIVVDLQQLVTATEESVRDIHQAFAEAIDLKRVVLLNVSVHVRRVLEEMGMHAEFDAVVPSSGAGPETVAEPPPPPPPPPRPKPAPPPPKPAPTAATPKPPAIKPPTSAMPKPAAAVAYVLPKKPKPPGVDPAGLAGKLWLGMKIGEEIGRGGLATVYSADQAGHHLALKVLHPWYSDSKAIVDQFLAEGNLGRRLDNENLVKVYGCGRHGKLHYVLLEHVPSISVLDLISIEGAIEERRALAIVANVGAALEYLEANAIIHGDVKPGNILVDESGRAKLCDFGQASQLELDPDLGVPEDNFGTPGYTAPERSGGLKTSDPRGEIYSLGITLYRMVAGIKPGVSGKIPLHPLHPQFLSDNSISPTVRYFIARMTVLDLALRYSGAREALKEIKKNLVGGREFKRDMQLFGDEYVEAYRRYMREHGTRSQKKGGTPK